MVDDYYRHGQFLTTYAPSISRLLEAGVHYGHLTSNWNPKSRSFVYGEYNGRYIIDLSKTVIAIEKACRFLQLESKKQRNIVFVGTRKHAAEIIESEATRCGCHFVNRRWLGGMLTNFETIRLRINKLKLLEQSIDSGDFYSLGKKEQSTKHRQLFKLRKSLGGMKKLKGKPDVLCIVDQKQENIALLEARKLGIKTIAIIDTDSDPTGVDYVIPGNDNSIRSIKLIFSCLADAIISNNPDTTPDEGPETSPSGVPKIPILPSGESEMALELPEEENESL